MARLLIVHHTPSPATQEMFEAARAGAMTGEITGLEVVTRPALIASAAQALNADGYLLGTPASYMSGALKHLFDGIPPPAATTLCSSPASTCPPPASRTSSAPPSRRWQQAARSW